MQISFSIGAIIFYFTWFFHSWLEWNRSFLAQKCKYRTFWAIIILTYIYEILAINYVPIKWSPSHTHTHSFVHVVDYGYVFLVWYRNWNEKFPFDGWKKYAEYLCSLYAKVRLVCIWLRISLLLLLLYSCSNVVSRVLLIDVMAAAITRMR